MKLSLSTNISKLRKEHSMTQEQLAEALCVTFASVSKWERGVATPDLNLIAEMADLFGVSFDALVGFEVQNGGADALDRRIHDLQREKKYDNAITEAEKALLRYPNDFRIVYRAGSLYGVAGSELKENRYLHRCIDLLERSILLLPQNTDPEISEVVIKGEIAQYHIILGDVEKGVEILKKYNVKGIHNALIAITYTGSKFFQINKHGDDVCKAEPYLTGAFFDIMTSSMLTMMAYGNYYYHVGNYESSRESYIWLADMLDAMKIDRDTVAYVDKITSLCYYECAALSLLLGEPEKVELFMQRSYITAQKFDECPTYGVKNIKFCVGDVEKVVAYDDLGKSAIDSIEKRLTNDELGKTLCVIWKKNSKQESCGGAE